MNKNLDLVYYRSERSRQKITELSQALKKTPQRLKYSIFSLEKEGIIRNPHCIFDYSYFGLILFRVYFKGGYIGEKDKALIIKQLTENPYIISVYELSGEFDLAIEILSPNPSRFNKELKKVASLISTLNNYKLVLNIVTHIYPRTYLISKQNTFNVDEEEILIGGDRNVENFNEKEKQVIMSLLSKPRIKKTTLAKETDLNVKTVSSIINNLKKRKIIRGFKSVIDTNKLGIYKSRIFLKLHNISPEREKKLLEHTLRIPEIVQLHKTVGDWDIEIDIESLDKSKIRQKIIQIREEFKDLIETFNSLEFYQYYTRDYLPRYFFQPQSIII
ncbi:MAG: Lrp/AsnC family transcriptional regulator [Nanoarchaeota archaeon]|nr:Lrp/AsnC family transcriptional regulator [Nanoarchaeota archaeon]MBU1643831.1 Lrp/AsnC family transcriptional regulator [Nanoarchaeota archaeon]MBU1976683.1 Lrp/AsnC family transcriptional regulator [Nanoarchaeota archaeon]